MCLLFLLELPSYGTVRTALPLSYTLFNKTATVQEIEVKIEQSEHFMFTGSKEVRYFSDVSPSIRRLLDRDSFNHCINYKTMDIDFTFCKKKA